MSDPQATPVEIAPVITASLGQDVAYHAPQWPYRRPESGTGIVLIMPRMDTSQTGLEDDLSREATWRWRRLPPPVAAYRPRTALGRKLLELRARIVASGVPLLDWDGVERELSERRGELAEDDA